MPPYQGGGAMIRSVSFAGTRYAAAARFEAGTPHIAGAIGLAAAVDWLEPASAWRPSRPRGELLAGPPRRLAEIPGVSLVGTAREKVGVLSFVVDGVHPTTWGPSSPPRGSRCAPATTARSR
jgi:cysteine desulfurase / selenocysteine lyase